MTNFIDKFYDALNKEMAVVLSTSYENEVTMRVVSPVVIDRKVLIFTSPDSVKYRQLQGNPRCCLGFGTTFAEGQAEFLGSTMLPDNKVYRDKYSEKFPDAFNDGVEFGGKNAEFILIKLIKINGWAYSENGDASFPTVPFNIVIE